jgi:hypothetical protein
MSAPVHRNLTSQVDSTAPKKETAITDSIDSLPDRFVDSIHEGWQANLASLQEWICELLIKNQQLRMTLMEMKTTEMREVGGRNANSDRSNPIPEFKIFQFPSSRD